MQLNITTDYAIRMTLFLASNGGSATADEINQNMAIPKQYISNIANRLRDAGILRPVRGYILAFAPEDISLKIIVETMEGTTRINRCLELDHLCSRGAVETCPVRRFYEALQTKVDDLFGQVTVAGLLRGELPPGWSRAGKPGRDPPEGGDRM